MKCHKCQSEDNVKAISTRGLQKYKCKKCGCFFGTERKSDAKSLAQKRLALEMRIWKQFKAIGRVLNSTTER